MKKLLLAGAALTVLAGPVIAADLPARPAPPVYKAPPVYVGYSWTGCFIGGNGGGVWVRKDYTLVTPLGGLTAPVASPTTLGSLGSHDANSWVAGAQVGCDYQFAGGWVIGIQGDYDWAYAGGSHASPIAPTTVTEFSRTTSLGSVTGRLGYAWDRFLGYVRGGWAWERDGYLAYLNTAVGGIASGTGVGLASQTRGGWTIGVGGEYAFTNWASLFVEYDYYDFGTKTVSLLNPTFGLTYENADIRERKSVVKAGLNFRWGPGPVVARY